MSCSALLRRYRAFLWRYKALLWRYRALLRRYMAVLRESTALLRRCGDLRDFVEEMMCRALLRTYIGLFFRDVGLFCIRLFWIAEIFAQEFVES